MHLLVLRGYVPLVAVKSFGSDLSAIRTSHISTVGKVLGISRQEKGSSARYLFYALLATNLNQWPNPSTPPAPPLSVRAFPLQAP